MVHASTFVLAAAAFAVAPALAAPATATPAPAAAELEAREPKFNFKKAFRGVARVAKTAGGIGMKVAPLLLRDVEDLDELDARDFEEVDAELMEREPKFNFKKAFRGVARVAKTAGGIGMKVAPLLLRDEEGNVYDARDVEEFEELDVRDPFNWGKTFRGIGRVAKTASGIAIKAAPLLLRDEEGNVYDARDFEELEELDVRDPFNWGKTFRGVARVAKTAGGIALKAAPLLLREVTEDLEELDARDFLDEESEDLVYIRDVDGELYILDAREPRFNLKKALHKVSNIAHKAVDVGSKITSVASQFGYRDLEELEERDVKEEMNEAREYEALDQLD